MWYHTDMPNTFERMSADTQEFSDQLLVTLLQGVGNGDIRLGAIPALHGSIQLAMMAASSPDDRPQSVGLTPYDIAMTRYLESVNRAHQGNVVLSPYTEAIIAAAGKRG